MSEGSGLSHYEGCFIYLSSPTMAVQVIGAGLVCVLYDWNYIPQWMFPNRRLSLLRLVRENGARCQNTVEKIIMSVDSGENRSCDLLFSGSPARLRVRGESVGTLKGDLASWCSRYLITAATPPNPWSSFTQNRSLNYSHSWIWNT